MNLLNLLFSSMALPGSEDTIGDQMVYAEKNENINHILYVNDTGAALNQGDFTILGPYACIADEDIASTAEGSIWVTEGIQVQTRELKTGENTFATQGQAVYFDATNLEFSDTSTDGYYLVGYLSKIKDSNAMIVFEKLRYAELVTT